MRKALCPQIILTLVAVFGAKSLFSLASNIPANHHDNKETQTIDRIAQEQSNVTIVCMNKFEIFSCHSSGTDFARAIPLQEERCKASYEMASNLLKPSQTELAYMSPSSSKQCPCKAHYSGIKCDTCADGYYMKYNQHRPHLGAMPQLQVKSSQTSEFTVAESHDGSLTKQLDIPIKQISRPFSCRPCNCNLVGSKSYICDKQNGTCFCIDGHTGARCNRCSLGYINVTLVLHQPSRAYMNASNHLATERQCIECGDCFRHWHVTIMDLKVLSVDIIKRAHELSQSLTSGMGILDGNFTLRNRDNLNMDTSNAASLVLSGSRDSFSELDETIDMISERVLVNKHNSDRLNLLASELDYCVVHFNRTRLRLVEQQLDYKQISFDVLQLNYMLGIQKDMANEFGKFLREKYLRQQLILQESIPKGAYKLTQIHGNRSRQYKLESLEVEHKFRLNSHNLTLKLNHSLEQMDKTRALLEVTGQRFLCESMVNHLLDTQLDVEFLIDLKEHLFVPTFSKNNYYGLGMDKDRLKVLHEKTFLARLLTEDMLAKFEAYSSSSEGRTSEMNLLKPLIVDSGIQLDEIGTKLDHLNTNVTLIQQLILSSFNGPKVCDFSQIIENNITMLRLSLVKVDAKLTMVDSELLDLAETELSINTNTIQLLEISNELNKTLASNLPHLRSLSDAIKVDFEDATEFKSITRGLVDNLTRINNDLIKTTEIKRDASITLDQTKALNLEIREGTLRGLDIVANRSGIITNTFVGAESESSLRFAGLPLGSTANDSAGAQYNGNNLSYLSSSGLQPLDLSRRLDPLRVRLTKLQVKFVERQLSTNRLVKKGMSEMNEVNAMNKKLLAELGNRYLDVLLCLTSIDGKNKTDIYQFESDIRRKTNGDGNLNETATEITTITAAAIDLIAVRQTASHDEQIVGGGGSQTRRIEPQSMVGQDTGSSSSSSDTSSSVMSARKMKHLSEQQRVADLMYGYQLVIRQLYQGLGKTGRLSDEFAANEQIFMRQQRMLQSLHEQMDQITVDIKLKLDHCQQQV